MNDLLIATFLDIFRIVLTLASAIGCAYHMLMVFYTSVYAVIEGSRHYLETNEPYQTTVKTFGVACKLSFHAFLAYWAFSIFYALVYNHPSTLMYYYQVQSVQ